MPRTLNVREVTRKEVTNGWGVGPISKGNIFYVRCNSRGEINWDTTILYTPVEIVRRGNYKLIGNESN